MLDRYKWRHDSILSYLHHTISEHILPNWTIYTDLPLKFQGVSTIPLDITVTTLRPDIVILNRNSKHIILFELSVPYELNIDATHQRKVDRYEQLVSDIREKGYKVKYYPTEIGSRAYISKNNNARLKSFLKDTTSGTKMNTIRSTICKIVLTSSFVIYHSKHEAEWINPSYVKF